MSLAAKKSPNATSLLLATHHASTNVWMIGRSMVSWSMSLKSAVATSNTTRLRRRVCGIDDDGSFPPPRMVFISGNDESIITPSSEDIEVDSFRLGDSVR